MVNASFLMGIAETEVAKDASDIILVDDCDSLMESV